MRIVVVVVLVGISTILGVSAAEPLRGAGRVDLAGVEGRFDHFAFDPATSRLFVAALGNNTLEVLDVRAGTRLASAPGIEEPQGIAFVPPGQVIVASGGNGEVQVRDASDVKRITSKLATTGDADNVRYDAKARRAYVGVAAGALVALDPSNGTKLGEVPLPAHPESFQLERDGPRIFVNVPNAHALVVVDRSSMSIVATWRVTAAAANYPMVLVDDDHRVMAVCRNPARVLLYDTTSGRMTGSFDIVGDADDAFFDATRKRLYVMGGQGFVDVFQRQDADHYTSIARVPTGAGARTGFWAAVLDRLFVAVPHRGAQRAGILMFDAQD